MKTKHTNTARQLLDLVFEGHHIRTVIRDGAALFHATETAGACGISKPYDIIKNHVEPDQLTSIQLEVRSASGKVQNRPVHFLTQSGVFALVMGSRKPAARRFQRWLADEVLPQLIEFGTYIPGATPAERLQALSRRVRLERAALLETQTAEAAADGLMTLRAFRLEHGIPARDALAIHRRLSARAKRYGITPQKLYLRGEKSNPATAYPRHLLAEAVNSTIPRLPFQP